MTEAGADSRANYLLKWEAMRTSREQGAVSYDMWGISHEGIEHFKAGFGGREIKYVGAWDLVLDPAGRLAFDGAQVGPGPNRRLAPRHPQGPGPAACPGRGKRRVTTPPRSPAESIRPSWRRPSRRRRAAWAI
jgi:hypothetical protein